jgi:NTP pyrophosphatase (non-canonical NTP hydrolase)
MPPALDCPVMTFDDYQQLAARTLGRDRTYEQQLANAALGLTGEAGETAEIIKKHLFHATPLDRDALVKELGDCLWYIGAFASVLDIPLEEIAQRNIDKLRRRYPDGFDPERSRTRAE